MLSIQLILNISNQWSLRTSFISDDKNVRKEASFAQWNQCGLLLKKKISLPVIFLIHLHCIFDSSTSPSPMVLREKHSFKTTWFAIQKTLVEELEVLAHTALT